MPVTWSGDDTTVEIEGTSSELLDFAERIEHCSPLRPVSLEQAGLGEVEGPPSAALTVRLDVGLMDVRIADKTLVIAGSTKTLSLLAQNVRSLAETAHPKESGRLRPHSHIEYYPGHFFLRPSAIPLIFSLRKADD